MIEVQRRDSRSITIAWDDGIACEFAAIWLWDQAPEHRDLGTGQRLIDVVDLPEDPLIADATVDEQAHLLHVQFTRPQRTMGFSWADLREHAWESSRSARAEERRAWMADHHAEILEPTPWSGFADQPEVQLDCLDRWVRDGVFLLQGCPVESAMVDQIAARFGYMRETNYGRLFDVQAKPDPNNLAYTSRGLKPHTDNPYRDPVPGIQVLHCLRPAVGGGETILVDGFAVAEHLRDQHGSEFARLRSTPIRFRFCDGETDLQAEAPLIQCNGDDRVETVRYNDRSMAPLRGSASQVHLLYRAIRQFSRTLQSERFQVRLVLQAGDALVLDNARILHGRTEVEDPEGQRWLQGGYVDRDGLLSRRAVLRRTLMTLPQTCQDRLNDRL